MPNVDQERENPYSPKMGAHGPTNLVANGLVTMLLGNKHQARKNQKSGSLPTTILILDLSE